MEVRERKEEKSRILKRKERNERRRKGGERSRKRKGIAWGGMYIRKEEESV